MPITWHTTAGANEARWLDDRTTAVGSQIPYFIGPIENIGGVAWKNGFVWSDTVIAGSFYSIPGILPLYIMGVRLAIARTGSVDGSDLVISVWRAPDPIQNVQLTDVPTVASEIYPLSALGLVDPANNYLMDRGLTPFPFIEVLFRTPILAESGASTFLIAVYLSSGFTTTANVVFAWGGGPSLTGNSLYTGEFGSGPSGTGFVEWWDRPNSFYGFENDIMSKCIAQQWGVATTLTPDLIPVPDPVTDCIDQTLLSDTGAVLALAQPVQMPCFTAPATAWPGFQPSYRAGLVVGNDLTVGPDFTNLLAAYPARLNGVILGVARTGDVPAGVSLIAGVWRLGANTVTEAALTTSAVLLSDLSLVDAGLNRTAITNYVSDPSVRMPYEHSLVFARPWNVTGSQTSHLQLWLYLDNDYAPVSNVVILAASGIGSTMDAVEFNIDTQPPDPRTGAPYHAWWDMPSDTGTGQPSPKRVYAQWLLCGVPGLPVGGRGRSWAQVIS